MGNIRHLHAQMKRSAAGKKLLAEKPLINESTVDFAYLRSLPEGSFGRAYAHFMDEHDFTPDERLPVLLFCIIDNESEHESLLVFYRKI